MKKILLGICLLLTTNFIFGQLSQEQEKLYKEVLTARDKKLYAFSHQKYAALDEVYDKNALIIKLHNNRKYSKSQLKEAISKNDILYDTVYDLSVSPHFYNNNKLCVLTGVSFVKTIKPTISKIKLQFTDIYFLDENNQWKSFYYQSSLEQK